MLRVNQPFDNHDGGHVAFGPDRRRQARLRLEAETIRDAIHRLGMGWKRAKDWITSPDPAYLRKKSGVTG